MTGPEHYREAERLIEEAKFASDEPENTIWTFAEAAQAAQVHATLALAAATALGNPVDRQAWAHTADMRLEAAR